MITSVLSPCYAAFVRVPAWLLVLSLLGPLACYAPGELGELGFDLRLADILYEYRSGGRVLVGTKICPHVMMAKRDDGTSVLFPGSYESESLLPCMDESVLGPAQFDADRCWSLDAPGEVTWSLSPNGACEFDGDSIRLQIVEPSPMLRLGFDDWRVRSPSAAEWLDQDVIPVVVGLAPGRTLADVREDPSAPRLVVNGQLDVPMLRLDDELGRVWVDDLELEIVGDGATAVEPEVDRFGLVNGERWPGERPLMLSPTAVVRIRATLPSGETLESPELLAVPPTAAASLDLMVASAGEESEYAYAYAEVRDAEGRVLHGAPIEWAVGEGALSVRSGDLSLETRTQEYAWLGLECEPPPTAPTERRATLIARIGELEDSVEMIWTALPVPPSDPDRPFEPDEDCMFGDESGSDESGAEDESGADVADFGCACASDERSPGSGGLLLLGLLALGLRRPRRAP
jgi:MYXO-CTERM domain-containing protein